MTPEFEEWARSQWKKIEKDLNPCNENNEIDPLKLNSILGRFTQNLTWLIVISEIESNNLAKAEIEFEQWHKKQYASAHRSLVEANGGIDKTTVKLVESKIVLDIGEEEYRRKMVITDLRSRAELLKNFVKTLNQQATVLQALSGNLRSEMFFASGVPLAKKETEEQRTARSKSFLKSVISESKLEG